MYLCQTFHGWKCASSWPSGSRRHLRWIGHGTDPNPNVFGLLSYLVIADYLLCVSAIPAEVRKRLKWGFRLFEKQTADDRADGKFRFTGRVSLEDSEESKFGFVEPGLCLSALKSRGFASVL
uniref:Pkinase_fungal domain-containing protein n=1 Tax=Heterorhabditis bacteriophora TaxID=37862 RepID=A0A1I7WBT0_HETBA